MMKRAIAGVVIAGCIGLASGGPGADEIAIRAVIEDYVTGWRDNDTARLEHAFDLDNGHVIWRQDEAPVINSMTFRELVSKRQNGSPSYGVPYEILGIDIIDGQLATAKFAVQSGEGYYIDLLTLMKAKDDWKVVTKEFTWHPGETWKGDE